MRKSDLEIRDKGLISQIMAKAHVCRLGLCKDNRPYIVPVNFGYDGVRIYFHTAVEGMKIDYFAANKQVCFEVEDGVQVIADADKACKWSTRYRSVIGFGIVEEIVDYQPKIDALNKIMEHYSGKQWDFDEEAVARTRVWAISIKEITGKQRER
jgi:uncharacterized protein